MKAFKCDNCKKLYEDFLPKFHLYEVDDLGFQYNNKIDLCKGCIAAIAEALKSKEELNKV